MVDGPNGGFSGTPGSEGDGHERSDTAAAALRSLVPGAADEVVAEVVDRLEWLDLESGATLFEAGDPSDAAYLVIRGRLRVTLPGEDGGEVYVRDLGRGEIVGELGLINAEPRSATIRAVRDTALARLAASDFREMTGNHPDLAIGVANTVMHRAASRPQRTAAGSVAIACVGVGSDFVDGLASAMERHGGLGRMSRHDVETLLSDPGITDRDGDAEASARVATVLSAAESGAGRLLLDVGAEVDGWTGRALRATDLLIVAVRRDPTDAEDAAVLRVVEALRSTPHVGTWVALVHPPGAEQPTGSRELRERYRAEAVIHVREDHPGDMERLGRLASGRGVGLVLGGGGARGFAHIGVRRALREVGVPVDCVGGSSMGAILAAAMALDIDDEELAAGAERQFRKVIDYTLPLVALAKGRRTSRQLAERFGDMDIEDLWTPFLCMSTNLTRTGSVVHHSGPLARAVRAGLSIPGVFPPTPMGEDLHVDAGVLDNLPIEAMRGRPGVGTVIAVDVAPPLGPRARSDYGTSVSGWKALRASLGRRRSPYPGISAVLMRSMILASMQQRDRMVASGAADLYLAPDLRGIGLLEFDRVRPTADAGYEAALPLVEEWAVEWARDAGRGAVGG